MKRHKEAYIKAQASWKFSTASLASPAARQRFPSAISSPRFFPAAGDLGGVYAKIYGSLGGQAVCRPSYDLLLLFCLLVGFLHIAKPLRNTAVISLARPANLSYYLESTSAPEFSRHNADRTTHAQLWAEQSAEPPPHNASCIFSDVEQCY